MRLAINGFGRIGRIAYRSMRRSNRDIDLVAVNDLTDASTLAHLLRYDSVHGRLDADVVTSDGKFTVGEDEIRVVSESDPAKLPWDELGIDVVIESTGRFRDRDQAAKHLEAGARKVIVSAPGKGADVTVVMGVNEDRIESDHDVLSNASCTTNCVSPVAKVLIDNVGWVHGLMTTTHAYTASQNMLDTPSSDLRRARAGALSMIPTTTGAAKAAALVLPELDGRIDGMAIRVPIPDVSLVDLTVEVERSTSADAVNSAFREAAASGRLEGILAVSDEPLVSVDYVSTTQSATVDALSTAVIDGTLVKVLVWYDNEMGYATRLVDLAEYLGKFL